MPAKLALWQKIALGVAVVLGLGYTPQSVYTSVASGLLQASHTVGTVAVPPKSADPVRDAILNVTTDFDELTHLLVEFMRTQTNESREQFREFMADRATRSYPRLEGVLDWLLSIYKFIFPFLIISMVAKMSGNGHDQEGGLQEGHLQEPEQPGMIEREEEGTPTLGRRLSGHPDPLLDRLPSRVLPRSTSAGHERGVPAPSTPIERHTRLPVHPAQLQGKHSQRRQHEVHALVRPT